MSGEADKNERLGAEWRGRWSCDVLWNRGRYEVGLEIDIRGRDQLDQRVGMASRGCESMLRKRIGFR